MCLRLIVDGRDALNGKGFRWSSRIKNCLWSILKAREVLSVVSASVSVNERGVGPGVGYDAALLHLYRMSVN